jgi:hypothetical protein
MSNREERERLRQQRLAAEAGRGSSDRRRLIAGYVVAGVLAAAVIAGLVAVLASGGDDDGGAGGDTPDNAHINPEFGGIFEGLEADDREGTPPPEIQFGDLEESAKKAGCELMLDLPDEGNGHVPDTEAVTYKTTPPTSGNHNQEWVSDGAYLTPLSTDLSSSPNVRNFIHSMEHGRIQIHYSPDLPEEDQLALKGVFDEDPDGILIFPDPNMPYAVAFTAWTQLVGCPKYTELDLDVLRNFRDTYRGNGPENIPF